MEQAGFAAPLSDWIGGMIRVWVINDKKVAVVPTEPRLLSVKVVGELYLFVCWGLSRRTRVRIIGTASGLVPSRASAVKGAVATSSLPSLR